MITQATEEFDYFGTVFGDYFPYLLLAGLPLFLLALALHGRPHSQPAHRAEASTLVEQAAAAAAAKTRYVDVDARSVRAPRPVERSEDIFDYFPPTATTTVDPDVSTSGPEEHPAPPTVTRATGKSFDHEDVRPLMWGAVGISTLLVLALWLSGWEFPGVDTIQGFTTAGWWGIGILVALTLPAIIRRARRQKSLVARLSEAATWLLVSAGAMALVVAAVGLGLSAPMFRAWFETPGEPQPTTVTTETIVPSSVTFDSGHYFGIILGGSSAEVSGLVETDDGVRTFSTSRYRYGDDWQLTTEKTCTTTTYNSPLVIQKPVSDEQCSTSTIAVLGNEIPEH